MPIEDRLGMIDELFEEKSITPARIQVRQEGTIKPMTKEQLRKCLWQFSAEERKEIGLIFRPAKAAIPVQIHTLQISKKQKELSTTQVPVVNTKTIAKKQARKNLLRHDHEEQKEISLELLKGIPKK